MTALECGVMTAVIGSVPPTTPTALIASAIAFPSIGAATGIDACARPPLDRAPHDRADVPATTDTRAASSAVGRAEQFKYLATGMGRGGASCGFACFPPDVQARSHKDAAPPSHASLNVSPRTCTAASVQAYVLARDLSQVGECMAPGQHASLAAGVGPEGEASPRACALGCEPARTGNCRHDRQRGCPRGVRRMCERVSLQPDTGARATRWTGARFGAARDLRARDERRINVADRRSR